MGFIKEFREFAVKGNVMDLAIGVIIGAAFGKIVASLVDNILMPIIGILLRGVNFQSLVFRIGEAEIKYGLFISAILDFAIIALVLFVLIKAMNKMKRKETEPEIAFVPTKDQLLLMEIRDLLKK